MNTYNYLFSKIFLFLIIGGSSTVSAQQFSNGLEVTTVADEARDVHAADIDGVRCARKVGLVGRLRE